MKSLNETETNFRVQCIKFIKNFEFAATTFRVQIYQIGPTFPSNILVQFLTFIQNFHRNEISSPSGVLGQLNTHPNRF